MLIFYLENRENIKNAQLYNNLAHLPLIIPSITRATATNRIRTMFTTNTTTNQYQTTTPFRSAFNNNNGIGTVTMALINVDLLQTTCGGLKTRSTSSSISQPAATITSADQMDERNGNICYQNGSSTSAILSISPLDNNIANIGNGNFSTSIRINNRNRTEIRITENPIAEPAVC